MTALLDAVRRHADANADPAGLAQTPVPGLTTVRTTAPSGLVYAISRPLVCLVLQDRRAWVRVLGAQGVGELHYWLLAGRHGPAIRHLGWPDGHAQHVARAVAVLRAEYALPLTVGRLAAVAGMSPSSFHRHFRAVTSLSPLQFQKRLRLIEARRLMVSAGMSASRAAFSVGYESVSQFNREYGRLFGSPPARDAGATRGDARAVA